MLTGGGRSGRETPFIAPIVFLSGMARQGGNDFESLSRMVNPAGGLVGSILYGADPFGSNNTELGLLGAKLAWVPESFVPVTRFGYVAQVARIPRIAGITAPQAVAKRNMLKLAYRLGLFPNYRMGSYEGFVAAGKSDAQIIASAGRTNLRVNAGAGTLGAAAAVSVVNGGCR